MEPKEDEWHCLNCQVQASLAEQAAKKLNKKKRTEERDKKHGKHSTKSDKHSTKDAKQSAEESKHSAKAKPVKSEKHNDHHDTTGSGKKRNKDAQKDEDRKLHKNKKKNGQSFEDKLEQEFYCPTCTKKDDGSSMVCCDDCDLW